MNTRDFIDSDALFQKLFFRDVDAAAGDDPFLGLTLIPQLLMDFYKRCIYTLN